MFDGIKAHFKDFQHNLLILEGSLSINNFCSNFKNQVLRYSKDDCIPKMDEFGFVL